MNAQLCSSGADCGFVFSKQTISAMNKNDEGTARRHVCALASHVCQQKADSD